MSGEDRLSYLKSGASFFEAVSVALGSLRGSKLRSFLTLLGIILATATLIAVMSVIHGMDVYIAQNVSDMGADGFRIVRMAFIGNWDPKKFLELIRKNPELRSEEYDFLKSRVRLSQDVGMQMFKRASAVHEADRLEDVRLRSVTPNLAAMTNVQMASGRMFTEGENQRRLYVVVIGNDLKETFFPNVDAVGKALKLNGRPFEVVGVARKQGSSGSRWTTSR